ncbi:MAG: hypothetical protein JWO44_203 [Bacteroidetes bacterium]|nr:hypothetical protein [Bacteroidota bacterium]
MSRKNILLIEPNYKNKYPPIGLMKLATYHKLQGDNVKFFKGDLKELLLEMKYKPCLNRLKRNAKKINWQKREVSIKLYLKTKRLVILDDLVVGLSKSQTEKIKLILKEEAYKTPMNQWDRVYIATLFTFYWEITIRTIEFAKNIVDDINKIYVGGVMASLMKDEIFAATGIKPHTGLLDKPGSLDIGNDLIIDELPLDYSILYEIDYQYPTQSAYFTYMTKGCTRKCAFCSVPKLEPTYKNKIESIDKFMEVKERFGDQRNLMLMDNNVLASPKFPEIISEIKAMGFHKDAVYTEPNQLEIAIKNLKNKINNPAFVRRSFDLIHSIIPRLKGDVLINYNNYLKEYKLEKLEDVTKQNLIKLYPKIASTYEQYRRKGISKRYVDFNQGTDARYVTEEIMKLMSEIPIRPLRLAFDHIGIKKIYINAVELAAKYGITNLSNYILYNFMDKPEDFYERIKINVDLGKRLNIQIFSFPMKYIPLFGEEAKHRKHIGVHWNRKFVRAVQSMLNATKGIVAPGYDFFEMAFGKSIDEFMEILWMPEAYIINRTYFQNNQMADRWKEDLLALDEFEIIVAKEIIKNNDFSNIQQLTQNHKTLRLLSHYLNIKEDRKTIEAEVRKLRNKFNRLIKKDIFVDLTLTHDFDSKKKNTLRLR